VVRSSPGYRQGESLFGGLCKIAGAGSFQSTARLCQHEASSSTGDFAVDQRARTRQPGSLSAAVFLTASWAWDSVPANVAETDSGKAMTVFVVHGRNRPEVEATKSFLRTVGVDAKDFDAFRFSSTFNGRFVGDVLDHAFEQAQAVVVILTGDDTARVAPGQSLNEDGFLRHAGRQPRPNVLIETGMALVSQPLQVILVEFPPLRKMTDLEGLLTVRFDGDEARFRSDLIARLTQAGCSIDAAAAVPPDTFRNAVRRSRARNLTRAFVRPTLWSLVGSAIALVLIGALSIATNDAYARFFMIPRVFPDFGPAELEENVVYANNRTPEVRPCAPGECLAGTSRRVLLATELFERGFSVLLFRKPRGTMLLNPTADLALKDIEVRVVAQAPEVPVPIEVGLLDVNHTVILFKCLDSTAGLPADFRLRFGPTDLSAQGCGAFQAKSVIQFSIGFATGVGSKPGRADMQILGIRSVAPPSAAGSACELQRCSERN
jgi:predicted nucleotide-binding protein